MLFGAIFILWLFFSMQSRNVNNESLQTDKFLEFESTVDYYSYTPKKDFNKTLIFFPGALVDTKAYIPLVRNIAQNNIKVYLIKMPWRQATMGYQKPMELGILKDSTMTYLLAGHSQGGKMAAQFVYENPEVVDKLILIGTSHPRDISLVNYNRPVLKIYGSNDGVADEASIMKNKVKLPSSTKFAKIEGGNHSQFGHYGFQFGDNRASISRQQQQQQTLNRILEFSNK